MCHTDQVWPDEHSCCCINFSSLFITVNIKYVPPDEGFWAFFEPCDPHNNLKHNFSLCLMSSCWTNGLACCRRCVSDKVWVVLLWLCLRDHRYVGFPWQFGRDELKVLWISKEGTFNLSQCFISQLSSRPSGPVIISLRIITSKSITKLVFFLNKILFAPSDEHLGNCVQRIY